MGLQTMVSKESGRTAKRDLFASLGYRKYKGLGILQKLWCQLFSRPNHQYNGPDWNMSQKTLLLRVHFLRVSILLSLQMKKSDGRRWAVLNSFSWMC